MDPNPDKAREILEMAMATWWDHNVTKMDLVVVIGDALGFLRGYQLPPDVLARYRCTTCGVSGVKLWRAVHSAAEAWCAKCGTAQAGLPDDVDDDGRIPVKFGGHADGKSDQIYSPAQGLSLLPWVPTPEGETWGYTSVPPEGCAWWRALPTRVEKE